MEMNTPMRSPQQARDDCANRRRESGSFSARGGTDALLPTPRRIPFALPEVAAAAILNSINKTKEPINSADLMGFDEESSGMSTGSDDDSEVVERSSKGRCCKSRDNYREHPQQQRSYRQ